MNSIRFGTVYRPVFVDAWGRDNVPPEARSAVMPEIAKRFGDRENATYTQVAPGSYLLFVNDKEDAAATTFQKQIKEIAETSKQPAIPTENLTAKQQLALADKKLDRFMESFMAKRKALLAQYLKNAKPHPFIVTRDGF